MLSALVLLGFAGGADAEGYRVSASEILAAAERGDPLEYDGAIVEGDLDLRGVGRLADVHFNDTVFEGSVCFAGVKFAGNANFRGAEFIGGHADFRKAKFSGGDVSFEDAEFSGGGADFQGAEFSGGDVSFKEAVFSGGDAVFIEAEFSGGDVDFSFAKFSGGDVNFSFVEFRRSVLFGEAIFSEDVVFSVAKFSGMYTDFHSVEFSGVYTDFSYAEFSGIETTFMQAKFICNADFSYTFFGKCSTFTRSTFKNASFSDSQFGGNAYFDGVKILHSLDLTRTGYTQLLLPWKSIDKGQLSCSDDDAYLALMRNYVNLGWYQDSNDCYYEYREKCRAENGWIEGSLDLIECAVYGYGVRPLRTLGWMAGLVLLFGLLFRNDGGLKKYIRIEEERVSEEAEDSNAVEIQTKLMRGDLSMIDPFLFSLSTLTSGLTSFLYPQFEYRAENHARLVILEKLLGSVFIALLITAISKTYLIR